MCVCVCARARACVCTGWPHSSSLIDHGQALPYLPIPTTIPHSLHPAASSKAQTKVNSVLIPKPFPLCPTCCVLKQRCREGTILMTDRMTLFPNFIHPCSTPESRSQCFENCCTKRERGVCVCVCNFFFFPERERERACTHHVLHTWEHERAGQATTHAIPQTRGAFLCCPFTHTCVVCSNIKILRLSLSPPHPPPPPPPALSLCFVCLYDTLMRLSKASTLVCKRARRAAGSCFSASAAVFSMLAKSHVVYSSSTLNRLEKLLPEILQYPCVRVCVRSCRMVSM